MRFGKTLKTSTHEPWKDNYIDYAKLKSLLREHEAVDGDEQAWTDEDEGLFVEELVNVQLEKVNAFQAEKYRELRERTTKCELELEELTGQGKKDESGKEPEKAEKGIQDPKLSEVGKELDSISKEINELEKFSRINYAGFLKAAKKHDRRRGSNYRVRALLQVRLAALPFNSEDYSPLLYRYMLPQCRPLVFVDAVIGSPRCTHLSGRECTVGLRDPSQFQSRLEVARSIPHTNV